MSFEKKFVTGEVLQQVTQGVRDKIKGEIVDNLESTDINKPLSANQGKILQDTKLGKNEKHEQTSDTITSMTGYEKAGTGVVLPTDSLNQAIGKLEVKADKALDTANNAIPKDNIVNDLTTGGTDNVLSAEQGKVLKQLISSVSGDGGAGGGLIENAKSFNKIVYNGTLTSNGKDIVVGKTLYNPSLYLDGTRIDASEYELNAKVGQITLKQPYAKYEVSWEVEDQLPNHIRFSYPTLDLLINDESIKSIINIGDVIEIQGASDADDGGHRLVKCEDSSKLNGVQIGEGKYLNEIPNTRISEKLDKGSVSIEYDTAAKIENKIKQRLITANTIEELKPMQLKENDIVEVLGYYTAGDGAGHKRKIEDADDGSGVQLNNGKWANIVHNGEVNVSWFGAKGDGVTDDTQAIKKAISYSENMKLLFSDKTYLLNETLTLTSNLNISGISSGIYSNSTKLIFDISSGDCINGGTDPARISCLEIRNITISTKQPKVANGISLYATYTKLENISAPNLLNGIYINGWYNEVNKCKTRYCVNGITLNGNACVLSNSFAQSSTKINIYISGRNITAFNNDFASYDIDNTQIGFKGSHCYGCNIFANYFEGYAQTMVELDEIGASNFSNFEISVANTATEKTMKLFDIRIFRTSVLDGFYLEPNVLKGQLKLDLGTIDGSYYSEIKNIQTKAIKGFKVSNSFILFDNILIDNIEDCEYSFDFNRHDYVRCTFNNIPESHFSKMKNLEYISGRSKILLINNRHSRFDPSSIDYSILGDTTYKIGDYPNDYFMLNTGSDLHGWLGAPLMDKYMRLDTPYWRDIMVQSGVWEDLVTYLNAKRKNFSVEPSEKLKQFCIDNNIK